MPDEIKQEELTPVQISEKFLEEYRQLVIKYKRDFKMNLNLVEIMIEEPKKQ